MLAEQGHLPSLSFNMKENNFNRPFFFFFLGSTCLLIQFRASLDPHFILDKQNVIILQLSKETS